MIFTHLDKSFANTDLIYETFDKDIKDLYLSMMNSAH